MRPDSLREDGVPSGPASVFAAWKVSDKYKHPENWPTRLHCERALEEQEHLDKWKDLDQHFSKEMWSD
jgi:hypothetical protein